METSTASTAVPPPATPEPADVPAPRVTAPPTARRPIPASLPLLQPTTAPMATSTASTAAPSAEPPETALVRPATRDTREFTVRLRRRASPPPRSPRTAPTGHFTASTTARSPGSPDPALAPAPQAGTSRARTARSARRERGERAAGTARRALFRLGARALLRSVFLAVSFSPFFLVLLVFLVLHLFFFFTPILNFSSRPFSSLSVLPPPPTTYPLFPPLSESLSTFLLFPFRRSWALQSERWLLFRRFLRGVSPWEVRLRRLLFRLLRLFSRQVYLRRWRGRHSARRIGRLSSVRRRHVLGLSSFLQLYILSGGRALRSRV